MKNIFLLTLIAIVSLTSCSDEIQRNTPSIQGELNGDFFRTRNTSATVNDDESVSITGNTETENIVLTTTSIEPGLYALGPNTGSEASFTTVDGNFYSTSFGESSGMIEITKVEAGTISGEFYFDAMQDEVDGDTINFNKGFFFEVPLTNAGNIVTPVSCAQAEADAFAAAQTYADAAPEDENAACLAYKAALEAQIEACGDEDGLIQTEIDELPCTESSDEQSITVTMGTLDMEFDVVTIVVEDSLVKVSGENANSGNTIYFEVAEGQEGDNLMQNFEIVTTSTFTPSGLLGAFTNNISANTTGNIAGTFSGTVVNDDNGSVGLTNGTFDLTY